MEIHPMMFDAAAPTALQPQDAGSSNGSDPSSANTATVTANDFLQLLIAEMRNQDPTANTDPTQYINQLVQVNSLEQLVQINDKLGGGDSTSSAGASAHTAPAGKPDRPSHAGSAGNLSRGDSTDAAAAARVAGALGGQSHSVHAVSASHSAAGAGNPFDTIAAAMRNRGSAASTLTTSPAR